MKLTRSHIIGSLLGLVVAAPALACDPDPSAPAKNEAEYRSEHKGGGYHRAQFNLANDDWQANEASIDFECRGARAGECVRAYFISRDGGGYENGKGKRFLSCGASGSGYFVEEIGTARQTDSRGRIEIDASDIAIDETSYDLSRSGGRDNEFYNFNDTSKVACEVWSHAPFSLWVSQ